MTEINTKVRTMSHSYDEMAEMLDFLQYESTKATGTKSATETNELRDFVKDEVKKRRKK
jgi:hypothetical protein